MRVPAWVARSSPVATTCRSRSPRFTSLTGISPSAEGSLARLAAATMPMHPTKITTNSPHAITRRRFIYARSLLHRRIFQRHAIAWAQTLCHKNAVPVSSPDLNHVFLELRSLPHVCHRLPRFLKRGLHGNGERIRNSVYYHGQLGRHPRLQPRVRLIQSDLQIEVSRKWPAPGEIN